MKPWLLQSLPRSGSSQPNQFAIICSAMLLWLKCEAATVPEGLLPPCSLWAEMMGMITLW